LNFEAKKIQMSIHKNFIGTGVAVITPFKENGEVDFKSLTKVVEHQIKGKVEYLVVLGTTGESVTLDKEEKEEIIAHVYEVNAGRVPLVIGIGGNDTREVAKSMETMNLNGYSAVLSASPAYNKPSQRGIIEHYKVLAKASPLPLLLYNVPGRTASNLSAETTLQLAEVKNIIGIKEASGNIEQVMKLLKNRPKDFLVISGDDNLSLPIIACGGNGVISVVANAFPATFSEMTRQALKYNMKEAQRLHYKLIDITDQLFADGNPGGVKAVMQMMKLCTDTVRLPLVPVNEVVRKKLEVLLKSFSPK
jgi:4-hydroxy-tetrahydrodipicolinate synthase